MRRVWRSGLWRSRRAVLRRALRSMLDSTTDVLTGLIEPPGLAALRDGELVPIGRKMTEPVQRRGGPVRHNSLLGCPLPRRDVRGQLEPRRPKVLVVWRRGPDHEVDAAGHPFERAP